MALACGWSGFGVAIGSQRENKSYTRKAKESKVYLNLKHQNLINLFSDFFFGCVNMNNTDYGSPGIVRVYAILHFPMERVKRVQYLWVRKF